MRTQPPVTFNGFKPCRKLFADPSRTSACGAAVKQPWLFVGGLDRAEIWSYDERAFPFSFLFTRPIFIKVGFRHISTAERSSPGRQCLRFSGGPVILSDTRVKRSAGGREGGRGGEGGERMEGVPLTGRFITSTSCPLCKKVIASSCNKLIDC